MEEGEYRAQLPELQAQLAAAGARGVWEARLPPELNAALQVRCNAAVVAAECRVGVHASMWVAAVCRLACFHVGGCSACRLR